MRSGVAQWRKLRRPFNWIEALFLNVELKQFDALIIRRF